MFQFAKKSTERIKLKLNKQNQRAKPYNKLVITAVAKKNCKGKGDLSWSVIVFPTYSLKVIRKKIHFLKHNYLGNIIKNCLFWLKRPFITPSLLPLQPYYMPVSPRLRMPQPFYSSSCCSNIKAIPTHSFCTYYSLCLFLALCKGRLLLSFRS